jgi:hypothetical protein
MIMKIYLENLLHIYKEKEIKIKFDAHREIEMMKFLFEFETYQFKLFDLK